MSGMAVYFIRRLLLVPLTFIVITVMVYSILRVVPGGPIEQAEAQRKLSRMTEGGAGGGDLTGAEDLQLSEESLRALEAYYSLDQPVFIGYLQWLGLWPREHRRIIPVVPREAHAEAYRLLTERADATAAAAEGEREAARASLASAEAETGYFLNERRELVQLAFRPLFLLKGKLDENEARLTELLEGRGQIALGGRLYRELADEEIARDPETFEEARRLVGEGAAKRDDLIEFLLARGYTWREGKFHVRLTDEELGAAPEHTGTAERLLAAADLARRKLDEIEEEYGYEISDRNRVYEVDESFSGVLQLDFGRSYTYGEPVLSLIGSKMEVSIQFGLIGYILAWLICVPLGVMKAIKHRSGFDTGTSILVFLGYSFPGFVLCMILLATFAVPIEWIPLGGYKPADIETMGFFEALWGRIRHMLIPVAGYMVGGFATMTILMKNSLLENLGQDYVRTAFAKGLKERRVIFVHALRNSLIPITAGIGHALGLLFAGAFLIELTCNIDGMGLLGYQSILQRDYPIILGLLVFLVLIQLTGNIISDIIWALIDPRIRFGQ